jgi:hypothetical protein
MGFDSRCLLRIQIVRLVPLFDLVPYLPQCVVPSHWQRELPPLEQGERMISVWAMGVFLLQWQDLDSQSHHLRTGRAGGRHHSERVAGLVQWCARGVRGEAQWACWIGVQETFQESKSRRRYPSINPGQLQLAAPPFLSASPGHHLHFIFIVTVLSAVNLSVHLGRPILEMQPRHQSWTVATAFDM